MTGVTTTNNVLVSKNTLGNGTAFKVESEVSVGNTKGNEGIVATAEGSTKDGVPDENGVKLGALRGGFGENHFYVGESKDNVTVNLSGGTNQDGSVTLGLGGDISIPNSNDGNNSISGNLTLTIKPAGLVAIAVAIVAPQIGLEQAVKLAVTLF